MTDEHFAAWMRGLEERHLADLRIQEVTRALRALSCVYVERRESLRRGAALDSAGKRAAFALFYGPLHHLVARDIVTALGAAAPGVKAVIDLGCGTGAVGAAWGAALRSTMPAAEPRVVGFDRHPWAVAEASWTYRTFNLDARARRDDVLGVRLRGQPSAAVAAFTVNELPDASRQRLLDRLLHAANGGWRALVIEPIAKPAGGWWDAWADAFLRAGGREDTWRFDADLPDLVRTLDRAAGLDHRVLTARSLYLAGEGPERAVVRPQLERRSTPGLSRTDS